MTTTDQSDGRRVRRERGRLAAIDAAIDIIFETGEPATPDAVVERAGISMASLFRYFETLDAIHAMAAERYFARYSDLFDVPEIGVGPLPRRVRTFVKARVDQHSTTAPIARLVRTTGTTHAPIKEALHRIRSTQADQVRLHFADEFAAMTSAAADDTAATVAVLTSFESWDQFQGVSGRTDAQTRRAWSRTLEQLFA